MQRQLKAVIAVFLLLSCLARAETVFFSPKGGCEAAIVAQVRKAKTSVLVQAYSFTSQPIAQALLQARMRHLEVRVILDGSWPTTALKVEQLLAAGDIPVLADSKHAIAHNKILVIDGAVVVTGSFNFTSQAEHSNAENVLVVRDTKLAAQYAANWQVHAAHSLPAVLPLPAPSSSSMTAKGSRSILPRE